MRRWDRGFRIGGDEFALVLIDCDLDEAVAIGRRILSSALAGGAVAHGADPFSMTIGVSAFPTPAADRQQLTHQADAALYWGKRHGRTEVQAFDPTSHGMADDWRAARGARGGGVARSRPTAADARVPAAVRPPDRRGRRVRGPGPTRGVRRLRERGRPVRRGRGRRPHGGARPRQPRDRPRGREGPRRTEYLSVNLSPRSLEAPALQRRTTCSRSPGATASTPRRLVVELTEREEVEDLDKLRAALSALRRHGVRTAADDVGAGNAGLRLLSEVSFDIMKIDLTLVRAGRRQRVRGRGAAGAARPRAAPAPDDRRGGRRDAGGAGARDGPRVRHGPGVPAPAPGAAPRGQAAGLRRASGTSREADRAPRCPRAACPRRVGPRRRGPRADAQPRSARTLYAVTGWLTPLSCSPSIASASTCSSTAAYERCDSRIWPGLGLAAEPRREDHRVADRRVVVAALEPDAPGGREPRRDPHAEPEVVAAAGPAGRQPRDVVAHRERHPDGAQRVVRLLDRVVEPDVDPVAGEVLERALVLDDPRPHRGVVLAQHAEELLRVRRLRERGVPAEVAEHGRDHPAGARRAAAPRPATTPARPPAATGTATAPRAAAGPSPGAARSRRAAACRRGTRRRGPRGSRPDRPGQVVDRPHLDAAHDPVELVEAGHDDHRDRRERRVRLHRGERVEPVEHRHDDVEQHEVDRPVRGQPVQRLLPVLRLEDLVAEALQELAEREPVDAAVVDDEDPPGPGASVTGAIPRPAPPRGRSTTLASAASARVDRAPPRRPGRRCGPAPRAVASSPRAPRRRRRGCCP